MSDAFACASPSGEHEATARSKLDKDGRFPMCASVVGVVHRRSFNYLSCFNEFRTQFREKLGIALNCFYCIIRKHLPDSNEEFAAQRL